jgi:hypothetical protein
MKSVGFDVLPERPNRGSWLAFVLLGPIGVYLAASTFVVTFGPVEAVLLPLGIIAGVVGFVVAYIDANRLDEMEASG